MTELEESTIILKFLINLWKAARIREDLIGIVSAQSNSLFCQTHGETIRTKSPDWSFHHKFTSYRDEENYSILYSISLTPTPTPHNTYQKPPINRVVFSTQLHLMIYSIKGVPKLQFRGYVSTVRGFYQSHRCVMLKITGVPKYCTLIFTLTKNAMHTIVIFFFYRQNI